MDDSQLAEAELRVRDQADRYLAHQRGIVDAVYSGTAPLAELASPLLDRLRRNLIEAGRDYDELADLRGLPATDRFGWRSQLSDHGRPDANPHPSHDVGTALQDGPGGPAAPGTSGPVA